MPTGKLILAALLLAGVTSTQAGFLYSFAPVAEDTGQSTFTAPALNDAGSVAYGVGTGSSQRFEAWPRSGGGTTLLDTSGIFASFTNFSPIPLNNAGTIAFRGTLDTGVEGIYTYGPGGLRTIADTTGVFSGFGPPPSLPALNDADQVAFGAQLRSGGSGVFLGDGATTTPLATTADGTFSGFPGLAVGLNNRGDAVMVGNLSGGGQALLLSRAGAPATPIVDTTGPLAAFGTFAQLNDEGAIAFQATLDAGGQSVFVWEDGSVTPVMSTSGAITFVGTQSINDRGTVSILTAESAARFAIYLYTVESGLHRLIGAGDSLFGSTVVAGGSPRGVFASTNSLNNLDELAFEVALADGRLFTVLATPVPEPVGPALLAIGLAAMGAVARKQRRPATHGFASTTACTEATTVLTRSAPACSGRSSGKLTLRHTGSSPIACSRRRITPGASVRAVSQRTAAASR